MNTPLIKKIIGVGDNEEEKNKHYNSKFVERH